MEFQDFLKAWWKLGKDAKKKAISDGDPKVRVEFVGIDGLDYTLKYSPSERYTWKSCESTPTAVINEMVTRDYELLELHVTDTDRIFFYRSEQHDETIVLCHEFGEQVDFYAKRGEVIYISPDDFEEYLDDIEDFGVPETDYSGMMKTAEEGFYKLKKALNLDRLVRKE